MRDDDEIWMSEIYYAGGTAVKDISANDLYKGYRHWAKAFCGRRGAFPGCGEKSPVCTLRIAFNGRQGSRFGTVRAIRLGKLSGK